MRKVKFTLTRKQSKEYAKNPVRNYMEKYLKTLKNQGL